MNLKQFFLSMVSDAEDGGISSKRVIGFLSFVVFISLTFINTYTDSKTPNVFVDGLMYIILGAFLGGTLEYFSKRNTSTTVKTGDDASVVVNQPPLSKPQKLVGEDVPPVVQVEEEDFIIKDDNTE